MLRLYYRVAHFKSRKGNQMKNTSFIPMLLNLQLFAEGGGDGGTGATGTTGATATAAVSQSKGAKSNPLADVQYGIQPTEAAKETTPAAEVVGNPTEDRIAKFDALIKGEYKDLFDARVQDILQRRLKSSKEGAERYEALAPTLAMLAKKYGVDATDAEALFKAIEDDDSFFEEEALERGISVEQLKEIRRIERENESLRKTMAEKENREKADHLYTNWMKQAEATQAIYPSFNLETELQNKQFVDLLRSNIDVRTAYEVIHKDQIIAGAMQFTAQETERRVTENIRSRGQRPVENGNSGQATSVTKSHVSQLTKADRAEIARRVARGDKIRF